jgi:hypothetical protein
MTRKGIEVVLKVDKEMNAVMVAAYAKVCEAARMFEHFAKDHPLAMAVFVTLIVIGVLMILTPYVVDVSSANQDVIIPAVCEPSVSMPSSSSLSKVRRSPSLRHCSQYDEKYLYASEVYIKN